MNMKNIISGIGGVLVLAGMYSCIDDQGSSPFMSKDEMMPVKITELADTTVEIMSTLKITPEINGLEQGREYSYLWYASPSVTAGAAPQRDTLSLARDLAFAVSYESGTYNLVFEVRDVKRNIYTQEQILMTVASNFNHGWYVLKDEADKTDIDFVLPDGTVQSNIIQALGMSPLDGKAKALAYQSGRYYHQVTNPDGTVTTLVNKKAIHVLSEKDMCTFNADNMGLFKDFEESFYDVPETKRPQNIAIAGGGTDVYLINAGKMHANANMYGNVGKYPYAKVGIYELADDIVDNSNSLEAFMWDKTDRTFYSTSSRGSTLNKLADQSDPENPLQISPSGMPVELVRFLKRYNGFTSITAYGVMKHPDKAEYYLADMKLSGYPFVAFDTLPADCKMPEADVMAAHGVSSCIYFAKGGSLNVYKNIKSADRETEIKTFRGETVSFIGNIRSTNKNNKFNNLVVLTNAAAGWKLYRFELVGETPEIIPEPIHVYFGKGTARQVIFRI